MEYFDIHCHILPGVDDGAQTMEEALSMIDLSYKEGTRSILLTPHYMRGKNMLETPDCSYARFVRDKLPVVWEMLSALR